jgi:hypothetical protein
MARITLLQVVVAGGGPQVLRHIKQRELQVEEQLNPGQVAVTALEQMVMV